MQHLSLTELNQAIKGALSANLEPSYWIVSEIGELREAQNGHCYLEFVEKDESGNKILSKARGTIWSYSYRNISAWFQSITGQQLQAGMTVLANVQVQFHEVFGLSLNVKDIDPNFTLGERAKKKQEILNQLEEDGIIYMNKAIELPLVPQKIAIISASSAAGFGDFMNQIQSNDYGYEFNCTLFNATMQGDKASETIIAALHEIHEKIQQFDAVVLIRGGGAQIDLDCFDNYELAAHIAQFPLPIFTGIGHERDETICDLVAHTKLKTPTAVAEFLIKGLAIYEEQLRQAVHRTLSVVDQQLKATNYDLNEKKHRLRYALKKHFNLADNQLQRTFQKIEFSVKHNLQKSNNQLVVIEKSLHLANPENIFKKGYSHSSINGISLHHTTAKEGDTIKTISKTQTITSTVNEVKSN